jgi:DnaJ-class molecular chaperone
MWQHRNYYDLLEVSRSATASDIRAAYRLQIAAWHPDKFSARQRHMAEMRTKALHQAYETLRSHLQPRLWSDPGASAGGAPSRPGSTV